MMLVYAVASEAGSTRRCDDKAETSPANLMLNFRSVNAPEATSVRWRLNSTGGLAVNRSGAARGASLATLTLVIWMSESPETCLPPGKLSGSFVRLTKAVGEVSEMTLSVLGVQLYRHWTKSARAEEPASSSAATAPNRATEERFMRLGPFLSMVMTTVNSQKGTNSSILPSRQPLHRASIPGCGSIS